ncbi:MAG: hypothetical protein ABMB14_20035 [Myxococcota bacterium]
MELDRKSLASFRVLVAVARADRTLQPEELEALKTALGARSDLLDALLAENTDVDAEIALLDAEERGRVHQSAFAVAYADGSASVDEVALLRKLVPNEGEASLVGQVFGETLDTIVPGRIHAEADPVKRDLEITEDILKYSVLSAVAGAMPVPGVAIVADLAVVAIQAKMVHDIGQYFGHAMDGQAVRGFMGSVVGSAAMRIAVNNLARFVPGWGSVFGATTSFATTYGLGRVAQRYFEAGRGLNEDELKSLFSDAKAEGAARYEAERARVTTAEVVHGKRIAELNDGLASGAMTRAQYDQEIARLGV